MQHIPSTEAYHRSGSQENATCSAEFRVLCTQTSHLNPVLSQHSWSRRCRSSGIW